MPQTIGDRLQAASGFHQQGRLAEAEAAYIALLRDAPTFPPLLLRLGMLYRATGRLDAAQRVLQAACDAAPGAPELWNELALTLHALTRPAEALVACDRAIALAPRFAEAHSNRGNALMALKRPADALASYDAAIVRKSDFANAYSNRANALIALNQTAAALASCDRAIALDPLKPVAHNNRGLALLQAKRAVDALAAFDRAIALNATYINAHANRGSALLSLVRPDEALDSFARALSLAPDHPEAFSGAALAALHCCDWTWATRIAAMLPARIDAQTGTVHPILTSCYPVEARHHLACARAWSARIAPAVPTLPARRPATRSRIRLGYVSGDFHQHATAMLIAELIERHDRATFDVVGFSFTPGDGSAMRDRLVAAFDEFHDGAAHSSADIARLIADRDIDIAIDLKGYTLDARPEVFAARPAPIQVSYLGYPGTMGADFIDYIIADPIVAPASHQDRFAEKIVRLPGSYQCNDRHRAVAPSTLSRSEAGLPEHGFVFCCFNKAYKITGAVYDVWMRVLRSIEGSVFWLMADSAAAERNLRTAAAARGVDPARLVFAPLMASADHLARHRLADLFLDTLPYNAHTTASDALWAGLPVVTCCGDAFAGRVGASLLHALGMDELVTESLPDYERLILRLATQPAELASLRAKLRECAGAGALFDTDRFRRAIEAAYRTMDDRHRRGLAPEGFAVADDGVSLLSGD